MIFEKNDKLVFIGDSISDYGRARPIGEGAFDDAWGRSYVAFVASWLGAAYPELKLRVANMGVNGHQIRDLEARWQTDVLDLKPDWVSVLIGINDVWRSFDFPLMPEIHVSIEEYEQTYERLIERTLPSVKGMILMTPYYMMNKEDEMRKEMDRYGAVVKKLAQKYGLILIDLQEAWDTFFETVHPNTIAADRIHPNQIGCMYIARQFLKATGATRI